MSSRETFTLKRLAERNFNVDLPRLSLEEWQETLQRDSRIPSTPAQLREQIELLVAAKNLRESPDFFETLEAAVDIEPVEDCGEELQSALAIAFSNPLLTADQIDRLDTLLASAIPLLYHRIDTVHFTLRWTDQSPIAANNIHDRTIVEETAEFLEHAWEVLTQRFGIPPFVRPRSPEEGRIDVAFMDLGRTKKGTTSPPEPITLNSRLWQSRPEIRRPTSAHELFHRLQYAFGLHQGGGPAIDSKAWFTEGTAAWSEVFVWGRLSEAEKLLRRFEHPDRSLLQSRQFALPFWIFFEARALDHHDDTPIRDLLGSFEAAGNDPLQALELALQREFADDPNVSQLDNFFARFSQDRLLGGWRTTPLNQEPHAVILFQGNDIEVPAIEPTEFQVPTQGATRIQRRVNCLASEYLHFQLPPQADGLCFFLTVENVGAATDSFSFQALISDDGDFTPLEIESGRSFELLLPIDLDELDAVRLIISGRRRDGASRYQATFGTRPCP